MRSNASFFLACLFWLLAGISCSREPAKDSREAALPSNGTGAESSNFDSEPTAMKPISAYRSDRFPTDETIGVWVTDDNIKRLISFDDVTFQRRWPIPDEGYVPMESMGHTLSAELRNGTSRRLANIEVRVTATRRETGSTLAILSTDSVIPYFLVPPGETVQRTIELTFGANGEDQSPFSDADSWPDFDVSVEILRARLIDDDDGR